MDWNEILNYALKIAGTAAGTVVITLGSILFAKLKKKILESRIGKYVEQAVKAAEQLFPNLGQKTGKEKLTYVMEQVQAKFPKIDSEYLKTLIESAVYAVSEEVKQIAKEQNSDRVSSVITIK